MSFRYLQSLFNPQSIAVIGASSRPHRIGSVLMRNLLAGGFAGVIMPVNPKRDAVGGVLAYPDVDALPRTPDLAIICTPAATIPGILEQLGRRGTRAAIVMAGHLATTIGPDGRPLDQTILETARRHGIRLLGGGTLGVMVPQFGLNATFSQVSVQPGNVGFVSQSDAVGTMVLDWALPKKVGFSHFVSLGSALDIGFGEALDFLGSDPGTRAILLYIESIRDRRSFMAAARSAARNKPVVAIKAGRAPRSASASLADPLFLDTPGLIDEDDVFDAVLRRAGILRVDDLDELFGAVETVVRSRPMVGNRLVVVSNGGGAGVMAEDSLHLGGYTMPELQENTVTRLRRLLPTGWDGRNPIDIRVDAPPKRYDDVLKILAENRDGDAILLVHTPNALTSSIDTAQAVIKTIRSSGGNLLTCWVGDESVAAERKLFVDSGIATFDTPEHATRAFLHMVNHRLAREVLMQVPPSMPHDFLPDVERARAIVRRALAEGRTRLTEPEAKTILDAYGIPVVESVLAANPQEVARVADRIGPPVSVTVMSRDIRRKWEVGGVALNVETPAAAAAAAQGMLTRIGALRPDTPVSGFAVQRMESRAHARQLIIGVATDPLFGPIIVFGEGGRALEVYRHMAVGLPPLNLPLAQDLIDRSRAAAMLAAYHTHPQADRDAIALTLIKVSQLVVDLPEIRELDINPLFADDRGVIAVDAHIQISAEAPKAQRLSIRPYPEGLEETTTLRNGRSVVLRPIRPEDEPTHYVFMSRLTPEDILFRFFHYIGTLPHSEMARLTQIDYDREMAFIASAQDDDGQPETLGVIRAIADPDKHSAEFSIIIRSDMKGLGLGSKLMIKMIDYARQRGIHEMTGDVMAENAPMLKLLKVFGFSAGASDEPGIVHVSLPLQEEASSH
ncbi:MAG TPA: bifunctional acetate--CoA ligase family protein/GNAT family N-acetyltransferase [Aromatoleum sp.]|uniref:bifunctional acetate--CoA ligase family protein/GNAT family N-acetyltransferase n=1 Tax=Aromatoleum sp. TaxID=2307007 RepID=UPI002B472927|nr:bifunctional acetate--CoA ligase family protein/GNAT family N-acetyltransferase [Aromatoleum sp.]HJV27464.1 bifunctional acetate--CoA ligase family protein/GNAT family N-acetyltransferase [Aromatoleum sp.]